jgi:long-chain acyl-CoA synthetase
VYESLVDLFEVSCRKFSHRELFGTKSKDAGGTSHWTWIRYEAFKQRVDDLRAGLAALGVGKGDRVAIVADNSVEWAAAAYATFGRAACYVPMYTAQSEEEWAYILKDSGAKVAIAANPKLHEALASIQRNTPTLGHVLGVGLPADDAHSFEAVCRKGHESPVAAEHPASSDLAVFIYTSGTTGDPKGVELTHKNLCSNVESILPLFDIGPEDRSLAFLPWAHAFGQTAELHFLLQQGCAMGLNDEIPAIVSNLAEVRPTVLIAVPRIFNRIYEGVNKQMAGRPAPIRALFRAGIDLAKRRGRGETLGVVERATLALAEKLIFTKVRARFGGRLRFVISGSAALNMEVAEFIDALGIVVYEGYGLSETSPVVAVNTPKYRKMGTVGRPIPNVKVSIDESKSDNPGEGEIIVHGPNVMLGYHNRPEDTAAVLLPDGGFRTGDLGRLDEQGFLTITGRIKEQYKLENGKYVAPALLEEDLKLSPYIANSMLYGANRPHNVLLVVPDLTNLSEWATHNGVALGDITTNEKVRQLLKGEVDRFGGRFKGYEKPKKIAILPEDFTQENGLLSQSMKVRRPRVTERYQSVIDALY